MHIAMFTNTFTPHVGGVARSVAAFAEAYRRRGHRVLVVAPEVDDASSAEPDVVRVPAVQRFNGSDFAMPLPIPGWLDSTLSEFAPDIVHAHHPFLLGDTALRVASTWGVPVVFTHHTQYEKYTHYVPGDSEALRSFVRDVAIGYANLVDAVVAPSASIAGALTASGVNTRIAVIPTGVDPSVFHPGSCVPARARFGIPEQAFVIGHLGRLAPEKNLEFLARAVLRVLQRHQNVHYLVVGEGPSAPSIRAAFERAGLGARLHMPGVVRGDDLVLAYRAMDVFAFASHTETQGMVLAEAMSTGVPVVAIDADGVREVVRDGVNGVLLARDDETAMARALGRLAGAPLAQRAALARAAVDTARFFTMERSAELALDLYASLSRQRRSVAHDEDSLWATSVRRVQREVEILTNLAAAAGDAVFGSAEVDAG